MNVGELVAWGVRMLRYLDEDGSQRQEWDRQRVEQAVGWVRQYRHEVEQWRQWVEVGTITEQFVKTHGLSAGGVQQLQHQLAGAGHAAPDPAAVGRVRPVCERGRGQSPRGRTVGGQ